MKLLSPWVCLMVTVASPLAYSGMSGVDAYREGHYFQARDKLSSASSGDPVASYYLGLMRLYGYGVLKNDVVALRFFKQAAERGILPAQQLMARYFLIHDNNPTEALYWFKKSADLNDTAAQMYCAAAYLFGVGVSKNTDVARRYYISASRNGNPLAQYTLAEYFMESKQIASQRLGLIWLEKAVEKNEPGAQVLMGQVMAAGVLVPQDFDKAKALMQQALAQGYMKANLALGDLAHQQGDDALAKTYYEKSAADKDDAANLVLGQLYLDPKSSLYHPETGFLLVLKSAQNEIKAAQKLLALLYKEGRGTAKDEHLAKEWEARAKKPSVSTLLPGVAAARWLTHNKASTWVASGYGLQGILTQWNSQHALIQNIYNQSPQMDRVQRSELYQPKFVMREPNQIPLIEYYDAIVKATAVPTQKVWNFPRYPLAQTTVTPQLEQKAILGDSDAQFQLGQCYQQGLGVTKDIQKAIKYYAQATALQDLRAEYNLGLIWLEGETGTPDYQQAMGWLNDAAFKGNVEAQYVLGQILQQGYQNAQQETVIKPDVDQALSLYHLASAMQYGPAEYELAELLVRDQSTALNLAEKQKRMAIMKALYQDAVLKGVKEAALPLAFFDAMSSDKLKQGQAYEVAEQAAQENNPQAALLYAMLLDRGLGVEVDHEKAISWYEKSPENPISAFILGTYATLGHDIEKGRALLEKSAQSGFSYAHLNLSILDKKENKTFLPSLIEAHRLGNTTASLLLADYYLTGAGAQDDTALNEARSIYQRLADKGDKYAQLKMGYMLEQGLGGVVDRPGAAVWYEQSAQQGQPIAQYRLGRLYQMGWLGSMPDYALAQQWYAQAKDHYAPAAVASGYLFDTVDNHYQQAATDYALAVKQGDTVGQFNLGLLYEKGKGRPVDLQQAKALYLAAAEKGHVQSMVQLAGLYFNPQNEDADPESALRWYQKAAEKGDREALYQMGLLSETGVELKLNYADAVRYYKEAALKENDKAKLALARMYQYGLGLPKNNEEAVRIYQDLASKQNAFAQYQLALLNYDGVLGDKNLGKAKQLLQEAVNNGSLQASKTLLRINAELEEQKSFIEPLMLNMPKLAEQSADLMYFNALSAWNRGDEEFSRIILGDLLLRYPDYGPAKHVYEQLNEKSSVASGQDTTSNVAKSV